MKKIGLIFDLDQTLIDSSPAQSFRDNKQWSRVYGTIPEFRQYEGIVEAMNFIKDNNIPYIIVTSSPSSYCQKVCIHWSFEHSQAVTYHDVGAKFIKPHPKPILLAVEKLGLPKENILSFGDRDIDILASNSAGVASVACLWGCADFNSLAKAKPTYSLKAPKEIIQLLGDFSKV